jgi:twitching motility two-component system response regulator PilH
MKMLLIEDSKFQRLANERALVKAGYAVIHAGDGQEGLRMARENIPDVILLDMMLPKVSGLDVHRALEGDVLVKHIPVIVLSGLGQANEDKLMSEGAAAFVMKSEKSFENNSSLLIRTVESVLTQSRSTVGTAAQMKHGFKGRSVCRGVPSKKVVDA